MLQVLIAAVVVVFGGLAGFVLLRLAATTLFGRCLAYGESATYWPLVEILRSAADRDSKTQILELLRGAQDADLVADRLGAAVGSGEAGAGASFIDFFSLPPYLSLGAILFALIVSITAALYPASRAARIDPVRALRHD